MQTQDNIPVTPAGSPLSAQQAQIQQVRQTVLSQVADLKQQIQTIQQQSLQNMLNDIDNVFTAQLTNSIQQIINQQQTNQAAPVTAPVTISPQTTGAPYITPQVLNAGTQAAGIATSNVDQAMKQAQQSVQDAESILNNTGSATNTQQ